MYGIYANIWGIWMVHVTIYSIHGSYELGSSFKPILKSTFNGMIYSRGSFAGQHCCCHRGLILGRNALKTSRNIDTSIKKYGETKRKHRIQQTSNYEHMKKWKTHGKNNSQVDSLRSWCSTCGDMAAMAKALGTSPHLAAWPIRTCYGVDKISNGIIWHPWVTDQRATLGAISGDSKTLEMGQKWKLM